jgi:hypothetical protein
VAALANDELNDLVRFTEAVTVAALANDAETLCLRPTVADTVAVLDNNADWPPNLLPVADMPKNALASRLVLTVLPIAVVIVAVVDNDA